MLDMVGGSVPVIDRNASVPGMGLDGCHEVQKPGRCSLESAEVDLACSFSPAETRGSSFDEVFPPLAVCSVSEQYILLEDVTLCRNSVNVVHLAHVGL